MTTGAGVPDVSVVIPVYNTMPYLTECLESVVRQTIGLDRLEVVAVDDGSTDDSAAELDRFAQAYPGTFTVIRQRNSGGPASPGNRGLEAASGRYVHFLGSDDYLGEDALRRLVAEADARGSDVLLGQMVGVNGRVVPKDVFSKGNRDVRLADSALPWALSDTKLFRRSLLMEHGIRYPEDLSVLCDHPLTLESVLRAGRVSVVGDYPCYYAVRREDEGNITFRGDPGDLLRAVDRSMRVLDKVPAEPQDATAVVARYLTNEASHVLRDRLAAASPTQRARWVGQVAALVREFATEEVLAALSLRTRLRMLAAATEDVALVDEVLAFEAEQPTPAYQELDGRVYAVHPLFRRDGVEVPDRHFDATATQLRITATWTDGQGAPHLRVTATSPAPDHVDRYGGGIELEAVPKGAAQDGRSVSVLPLEAAAGPDGTVFSTEVPATELARAGVGDWTFRLRIRSAQGEVVRGVGLPALPATKLWLRGQLLRAATVKSGGGLALALAPITVRGVVANRLRALRATGRK